MAAHEDSGIAGREEAFSSSGTALGEGITPQDTIAQPRVFAEKSRRVLDNTTVESEYRAGYTTVAVRSIFSGTCALPDLVREIATRRLMGSANEITRDDC